MNVFQVYREKKQLKKAEREWQRRREAQLMAELITAPLRFGNQERETLAYVVFEEDEEVVHVSSVTSWSEARQWYEHHQRMIRSYAQSNRQSLDLTCEENNPCYYAEGLNSYYEFSSRHTQKRVKTALVSMLPYEQDTDRRCYNNYLTRQEVAKKRALAVQSGHPHLQLVKK